jgi:hypothetical protein
VLTWVLGDKKTLTQVTEILGMEFALSPEKQKQLSLAAHLRNCLDIVAGELGLTTNGCSKPRAPGRCLHDQWQQRCLRRRPNMVQE